MKRTLLWFTIFVVVGIAPIYSQEDDDVAGKGVARLSLISGDVSVRRGDTGEWVAGAVNGPLVVGDYIQSGAGSRAEIQFDWANLIRLSSNTEVRLPQLDQANYQIQLAQGTVTLSAIRDSEAQININTPSVSIRPTRKGRYRIEVRDEGGDVITEVSVRSGEVEVYSPQGVQRLTSGRAMQIRGEFSNPEFQNVAQIPLDDWDRWNERRDQEMLRSQAYKYVPQDVYGADELDQHGTWVDSPQYGRVWAPQVAAGWAPYQNGRWAWIDYYGWNWISYDTWGWAPYHYGRWFWNANRWCWWPGQMGVRTFWRPALVAWVGWGGGGVGIGFGGGWNRIGWVPLAPYERFRPWYGPRWYGRGGGYNQTTIINNINVTNIYRNSRVNNGVTVVQAQNFGKGQMDRVRLGANDLSRAYSSQGRLPMVPDRDATRMSDRMVAASQRNGPDRQFYSRSPIPESRQISFEDQRQGIERSAQRAFGRERTTPSSSGFVASDQNGQGGRVAIPGSGNGWRRAGDGNRSSINQSPSGTDQQRMATPSDSGRRGGWQRFGEPRQSTSGSDAPVSEAGGRLSQSIDSSNTGRMGQTGDRQSFGRSPSGSNNGWTRFGESTRTPQPDANGFNRINNRVAPESRMDRSSGNEIQVNPPVVQERGFGRGSSSMPSRSAPQMINPQTSFGRGGMDSPGRSRGGDRGFQGNSAPPRMSNPGGGAGMRGGGSSGPSMSSPGRGPSMSGGSRGGGGGGTSPSRSPSGGGRQGGGGGGRR